MRLILWVLVGMASMVVWQSTALAGTRVDSAPMAAAAADAGSGEKKDGADSNDEEPDCE